MLALTFKHKIALDLEVTLLPVIKKCNCFNTLFKIAFHLSLDIIFGVVAKDVQQTYQPFCLGIFTDHLTICNTYGRPKHKNKTF